MIKNFVDTKVKVLPKRFWFYLNNNLNLCQVIGRKNSFTSIFTSNPLIANQIKALFEGSIHVELNTRVRRSLPSQWNNLEDKILLNHNHHGACHIF